MEAADQFPTFMTVEEPQRLSIDGYAASSGIYIFALRDKNVFLNTDGRKTVSYLTVVRRGQELIRFIAVCPPDEWLEYRPTIEAIMQSIEISPRQY